ncbi:MAG: hypothetical protein ABRQ37_27240, partial [Candidatus Eremiobacterota bacterium]
FHWELEFADLFFDKGGFDLIVGNPPWVKIEWNEGGLLSDYDPIISLKKFSASDVAKIRENYLKDLLIKSAYLNEFEEFTGSKSFMNGIQNYPYLKGLPPNLYKCFITYSWRVINLKGISSFLHPDGVYDAPKGQILLKEINQRLKYHFQFINQLKLFPDIGNTRKYSINIYKAYKCKTNISYHIFNLFHTKTIEEIFEHNGCGEVDGIKDKNDKWNLKGHKHRLIKIDSNRLKLFANILYNKKEEEYLGTQLLAIHSEEIIKVIEKFSLVSQKWENKVKELFITQMWDENSSQKLGIIKRDTCWIDKAIDWIISGPHFYLCNPLNKTPNEVCDSHRAYTCIDLTTIDNNFLPRTNFLPSIELNDYINCAPKWNGLEIINKYHCIFRRQIDISVERTLSGCIAPPYTANIDSVIALYFDLNEKLVTFNGFCSSLPYDFFIKIIGKSDFRKSTILILPYFSTNNYILNRTLRLNCLTIHYLDLWNGLYTTEMNKDSFSKKDHRLKSWKDLTSEWSHNCAIRTPYERRQALVEIDALSALSLGLTIEELLTIYRVQFPVLQQYEKENHYDQNGLLIPNEVLKIAQKEGIDITKPGNSIKYTDPKLYPLMEREYITPFDTCDREADMRQAYEYFCLNRDA